MECQKLMPKTYALKADFTLAKRNDKKPRSLILRFLALNAAKGIVRVESYRLKILDRKKLEDSINRIHAYDPAVSFYVINELIKTGMIKAPEHGA